MLGHCDLHELGHVEGEGEGGDWYDVDQEASRVRHCQADRSILVGPADGNIPKTSLFCQIITPRGHTLSCKV